MRPPPWLPPAPQRLTLPRAAFRVHPASDRSDRLPRPGLSPFALSTRSLGPPSLPEVSCRDRPIPPPLAPEVPALPVLLTQRPAARRLGHPRARWPRLWARPAPPGASAPPVRSARRALRVPRTPHSHCAGSLPACRLSREAVPAPPSGSAPSALAAWFSPSSAFLSGPAHSWPHTVHLLVCLQGARRPLRAGAAPDIASPPGQRRGPLLGLR